MPAILLALLMAALLSPAAAAVRCPEECGGVKIPYPFGIGRGCYLETATGDGGGHDEPFNVTCSNRDADGKLHPKPIPMVDGGLQVLDIDVAGGRMRAYTRVSSWCRNAANTSPSAVDDDSWVYESATFRVSGTENVLTVVGCGVLAYIGTQDRGVDNRYVVGCNASCPRGIVRPSSTAAAAASGVSSCDGTDGCCQTTIQRGIRSFVPSFVADDEDRPDGSGAGGSPCRYAFLVEKEKFKFRTSYVTNRELAGAAGKRLPLVLDWAVGNKSCVVSQKDKATYACLSDNHECVNSTNGAGYLCKCKTGYRGNPYRNNGCEYIDMCKEKKPCHASAKCDSIEGGYRCSCHRGRRLKADGSGGCEIDYLLPVIGSSIGVVVLAVVLSCTYAVQEKKRLAAIKKRYFRQHGGLLLFEEMKQSSPSSRLQGQQTPSPSFTLFTEKELEQATDRFDERHVLGKGGNGTVYRGDLRDGRAVAIKRCRVAGDERQRRELGKEVLILSQVSHRNIVKLYGCCLEVAVPMLVYEFIPNGTLCELLHGQGGEDRATRASPPSFAIRLKIAHEAAEALAYLHSTASPPKIIHGDVKSANILLDDNYDAKVSDFGASALAPPPPSSSDDEAQAHHHLVTLVQGTCGYLDPEYLQTCRLTDRSDVYSFGVVLLELLTRRKALALAAPVEEERSLVAHFLSSLRNGRLDALLDAGIRDEVGGEVLGMVAALAKRCLEMSGEIRPPMREVAEELDRVRKLWRQRCFGEVAVLVN
ncbi:wall-associated receptor kinase 4 [Sorghum bicolor]|uniref:Protein kinase domain-containing protein n=1 Tax=Sorghum bicolor TaxID=4558 RepID=C5YPW5_SORBI|nr:wall-associated receptor kinase 4 [Sorghum bicolor]EES17216.1 hypothetical protein SORBI_3008G133100 [Sorghum bicolor]|eukprot:XP_002443378.1 wall-associated receptor kinase 4 [Sorghum bicolor]